MFTLDFVTENNKKEAIEILRKHGNRINFAHALEDGSLTEDNFDYSDLDTVEDDYPCVILDGGNGPYDAYVLAVKVNTENEIEILVLDPEENYTEWVSVATCCSYSENDVYLTIDNYDR